MNGWSAICRAAGAARIALLAVAVGIAGNRAFDRVADAVPRIAGGELRAVPAELRLAPRLVPAAAQIGLDAVEGPAGVGAVRAHAVAVGRAVVVVTRAIVDVGTVVVVLAPIGVF